MNHLKDWVGNAHPGVKHFLTYADNYAFGYFKKQVRDLTLASHFLFLCLSTKIGFHKGYHASSIILGGIH